MEKNGKCLYSFSAQLLMNSQKVERNHFLSFRRTPDRGPGQALESIYHLHISSYDASYLDLAMRKGLPIATLDNGLIAAAKLSQVPIVEE